MTIERRLPVGAELVRGGVHFRLFAPKRRRVDVVVESGALRGKSAPLERAASRWTDSAWKGVSLRGQVIHEMHVGTFTREGTYAAAARELEELRRVGVDPRYGGGGTPPFGRCGQLVLPAHSAVVLAAAREDAP